MGTLDKRAITRAGLAILVVGIVLRSWSGILALCATVLTAAAPLIAGAAIAYIVNILMAFLERHILPRSTSKMVAAIKPAVCMVVSFLLIVAFVATTASLLVPALVESVDIIGARANAVVAWAKGYQPIQPIVHTLVSGDLLEKLSSLDVAGFLRQGFTSAMGPITSHLAEVATSAATFFFGLLFSAWLLLDKAHVAHQMRALLTTYLGEVRYARFAYVCEVFDRSYHGYIVRQCAEAAMLGVVSVALLLLLKFQYALGISALVVFAALIPVVGIPSGVCVGAFLVLTDVPWQGIVYLVAMFIAQGMVETFIMPHVGDRRILLSPVWVTVAVTLGGGLFGFLGMISTTPLAAAIHQLLQEDVERRGAHAPLADASAGPSVAMPTDSGART